MALWSCHSGVQPTWCASSKVSGWGWSGGTLLRRVIGLAGLFFLALGFRALLAVLLLVSQSSVVVLVAVVFSPSVGGSAAMLAMLSEDKLRLVVAVLESSTEVLIWSPLQLLARRMRREHCQRTSPPVVEPLRSVKVAACRALVLFFHFVIGLTPLVRFIGTCCLRLLGKGGAISRTTSVPRRLFSDSPRLRPLAASLTTPMPVLSPTRVAARAADFSIGRAVLKIPRNKDPMPKPRWYRAPW